VAISIKMDPTKSVVIGLVFLFCFFVVNHEARLHPVNYVYLLESRLCAQKYEGCQTALKQCQTTDTRAGREVDVEEMLRKIKAGTYGPVNLCQNQKNTLQEKIDALEDKVTDLQEKVEDRDARIVYLEDAIGDKNRNLMSSADNLKTCEEEVDDVRIDEKKCRAQFVNCSRDLKGFSDGQDDKITMYEEEVVSGTAKLLEDQATKVNKLTEDCQTKLGRARKSHNANTQDTMDNCQLEKDEANKAMDKERADSLLKCSENKITDDEACQENIRTVEIQRNAYERDSIERHNAMRDLIDEHLKQRQRVDKEHKEKMTILQNTLNISRNQSTAARTRLREVLKGQSCSSTTTQKPILFTNPDSLTKTSTTTSTQQESDTLAEQQPDEEEETEGSGQNKPDEELVEVAAIEQIELSDEKQMPRSEMSRSPCSAEVSVVEDAINCLARNSLVMSSIVVLIFTALLSICCNIKTFIRKRTMNGSGTTTTAP
jgi:hypothetical protein